MADYYVKLRDELTGPYQTHTAALDVVAYMLGRIGNSRARYRPRILLDTGSVNGQSRADVSALLHNDPLLSYVFALGQRHGREGGEQ